MRTPVDYTLATIDKPLIVKIDENLFNGLAAALVHCETLSVPVAGGTHFLELFDDSATELFFPLPCSFEKALTSDIFLCDTLFTHGFNDFSLSCNRCVIRSGKPQSVIALHSSVTDKNILKCVVKCMTHVKLAGDVRRRYNYSIRLLLRIALCVKVLSVEPEFIYSVLNVLGIVLFSKIFCH